jgi:hypothetical protein
MKNRHANVSRSKTNCLALSLLIACFAPVSTTMAAPRQAPYLDSKGDSAAADGGSSYIYVSDGRRVDVFLRDDPSGRIVDKMVYIASGRCITGWAVFALCAVLGGCASRTGPPLAPSQDLGGLSIQSEPELQLDGAGKKAVYVSNLYTNVTLYAAGTKVSDPPAIETITNGVTRPEGLWIDHKGNLYVVNGVNGKNPVNVTEYKRGQTSPYRVIGDGLTAPTAVAVGRDGTVYVNDVRQTNTGVVVIYGPGQSTPERTITLPDSAYDLTAGGMTFDTEGNLLVATLAPETNTVHVFSIAPGSSTPVDLGLQNAGGPSIAMDGAGNLYTSGTTNDYVVAVFAPGATSPERTFTLDAQPNFITVARDGTLYVALQRGVAEIAPGGDSVENVIDKTNYAYGVALGPQ